MSREILTIRIAGGWSSPNGRIRCLRDTELQSAIAAGATYIGGTRTTFWDVELLDVDLETVLESESVNTLDQAEDEAWIWADRIAAEGGRA